MAEPEASTGNLRHEWACAHVAIVPSAKQHVSAGGYANRQGVTGIVGLMDGAHDAPGVLPLLQLGLDCQMGRHATEGAQ